MHVTVYVLGTVRSVWMPPCVLQKMLFLAQGNIGCAVTVTIYYSSLLYMSYMKGIRVCDSSNSPEDCSGKVNSTKSKTLTPLERVVMRGLALAQYMIFLAVFFHLTCNWFFPSMLACYERSHVLDMALMYIGFTELRFMRITRMNSGDTI